MHASHRSRVADLSLNLLKVAGLGAALHLSYHSRFNDVPGFKKDNFGRTVNGVATVLGGIITRDVATNAAANLTIVKAGWPDSNLKVHTSGSSISAEADLSLSSCVFSASGNQGSMQGDVDKSAFDWKVKEAGLGKWTIERFGPYPNYTLDYTINNGVVTGTIRRPLEYDWNFDGSIKDGNISISVHTGITEPSFKITGTIHSLNP